MGRFESCRQRFRRNRPQSLNGGAPALKAGNRKRHAGSNPVCGVHIAQAVLAEWQRAGFENRGRPKGRGGSIPPDGASCGHGREVDGVSLLRRWSGNRSEGSNPSVRAHAPVAHQEEAVGLNPTQEGFESLREYSGFVRKTTEYALVAEWNRRKIKDLRHPKGRFGFESRRGYEERRSDRFRASFSVQTGRRLSESESDIMQTYRRSTDSGGRSDRRRLKERTTLKCLRAS